LLSNDGNRVHFMSTQSLWASIKSWAFGMKFQGMKLWITKMVCHLTG